MIFARLYPIEHRFLIHLFAYSLGFSAYSVLLGTCACSNVSTIMYIHNKAQPSFLCLQYRRSSLTYQNYKQQWNLRRYDNPPAKKQQGEYECHTRRHLLLTLCRFDTNKVANLSSIYNKASINAFYLMNPSNPQPYQTAICLSLWRDPRPDTVASA